MAAHSPTDTKPLTPTFSLPSLPCDAGQLLQCLDTIYGSRPLLCDQKINAALTAEICSFLPPASVAATLERHHDFVLPADVICEDVSVRMTADKRLVKAREIDDRLPVPLDAIPSFRVSSLFGAKTYQATVRINQSITIQVIYAMENPMWRENRMGLAVRYDVFNGQVVVAYVYPSAFNGGPLGEVVVPVTERSLPLPRDCRVTVQVERYKVIYTTHGQGGGSVTIDILDTPIIGPDGAPEMTIREMLTQLAGQVTVLPATPTKPEVIAKIAGLVFNKASELTFRLIPDPEAWVELLEEHKGYLTAQAPWDLDHKPFPRWVRPPPMHETNSHIAEDVSTMVMQDDLEERGYNSDPGMMLLPLDAGFMSE